MYMLWDCRATCSTTSNVIIVRRRTSACQIGNARMQLTCMSCIGGGVRSQRKRITRNTCEMLKRNVKYLECQAIRNNGCAGQSLICLTPRQCAHATCMMCIGGGAECQAACTRVHCLRSVKRRMDTRVWKTIPRIRVWGLCQPTGELS